MKKNGQNVLTWDEMLKVEDQHPFFAGNLRSLRSGGFSTPSNRDHPPVRHLKRKSSHSAKFKVRD